MSISLTGQAIKTMIIHAINGYEKRGKKESGGHLLGYKNGNRYCVAIAEPYMIPSASAARTWWGPNQASFARKGRTLENDLGVRWVGVYHTHVEIAQSMRTGQSDEDKMLHVEPVQIIVSITNGKMSFPEGSLRVQIMKRGYKCCVRGWTKDSQGRSKVARVNSKTKRIPLGFL